MALSKKEASTVASILTDNTNPAQVKAELESIRDRVTNKSFRKHLKKVLKAMEPKKKANRKAA